LGDKLIGCFCARFYKAELNENDQLYILTFGLLAQHRRYGIGRYCFSYLTEQCRLSKSFNTISLHVQDSNLSAIKFYKKAGFVERCKIEGYYKRIQPSTALLMSKTLE
jgi:ribosomal protein S18 acetylase RimI-like enzyme